MPSLAAAVAAAVTAALAEAVAAAVPEAVAATIYLPPPLTDIAKRVVSFC